MELVSSFFDQSYQKPAVSTTFLDMGSRGPDIKRQWSESTCQTPTSGPLGEKQVMKKPRNKEDESPTCCELDMACLRKPREDFGAEGDTSGPPGGQKGKLHSFNISAHLLCVREGATEQDRPFLPFLDLFTL